MNSERVVLDNSDEPKHHRACQACRVSKVRCRRPDDEQSCARCSKAGRSCVPFQESNKRQKRLDSRNIDDVESRLEVLTAVLQQQGMNTPAVQAPITKKTTAQVEASLRSIIDDETTSMIFDHFIENMLPHFPFILIPSGSTAEDIRRDNPLLLLAIMNAAGDGYYDTKVSQQLRRLLAEVYSQPLLKTTTDHTSVLQAFVISVLWWKDLEPPQAEDKLDVFDISRTAANLTMNMNLGNRLRDWSWTRTLPIESDSLRGAASEYQFSTLEVRRMWLACYYICSNTSLASQTPNVMRWSRQMEECLEVLEASPAALASDKVLCAHIRLQHILEETEEQLSSAYGLRATGIAHKVAKRQLSGWTAMYGTSNDSLKLSLQFTTLYIHEMAVTSRPVANSPSENAVNAVTITSTQFTEVLAAAHNFLDTFLSLDISLIRTLPTSYFVQITHAAISLFKLYYAAVRQLDQPDSQKKLHELKADDYLKRLVKKLSGWDTLWPFQKLAQTFRRLQKPSRQSGDQRLASEMAFLDVWSLEEASGIGFSFDVNANRKQGQLGEKVTPGIHPTSNEDESAWGLAEMNQMGSIQDLTSLAFPSEFTQMIDWFGTDLNTSTFDFDGNLQSMVQFLD